MLICAGDKTTVCGRRLIPGRLTSTPGTSLPANPYWIKLDKVGNILTAYISSDGINWTHEISEVNFENVQLTIKY